MPSHAAPPASDTAISRPRTLMTLALTVSALTVVALLQSPMTARADGDATEVVPITPTSTVLEGRSTSARLATVMLNRERRVQREQHKRRELRRERRADAHSAARAAARPPQWVMPVPGAGWSASFGEAGSAWSSGFHTGQDFTAPAGTPVHAVGSGTITSASWSDAYGNLIEITHANGDQSWYAHLSDFAQTSGAVAAGDVIGYVGCTGNCFGNHLHLEYHPDGGEAADPVAWLRHNGALG